MHTTTAQMAKHLREVYFGGNWTASNLRDQLQDVDWREATIKVYGLNPIAVLVNHLHYYVGTVTKVLEGGPLEGKDALSFTHPPIGKQAEWDAFLAPIWEEAEALARLIEALPDERLTENFAGEKYGNYYRNLQGLIEHTHYHLGQVAVLKKVLRAGR